MHSNIGKYHGLFCNIKKNGLSDLELLFRDVGTKTLLELIKNIKLKLAFFHVFILFSRIFMWHFIYVTKFYLCY